MANFAIKSDRKIILESISYRKSGRQVVVS